MCTFTQHKPHGSQTKEEIAEVAEFYGWEEERAKRLLKYTSTDERKDHLKAFHSIIESAPTEESLELLRAKRHPRILIKSKDEA